MSGYQIAVEAVIAVVLVVAGVRMLAGRDSAQPFGGSRRVATMVGYGSLVWGLGVLVLVLLFAVF